MSGQLNELYAAVKKPKKLKTSREIFFPQEPQEYETPVNSYTAVSDLRVESQNVKQPETSTKLATENEYRNTNVRKPHVPIPVNDSAQLYEDSEHVASSTYSRLDRRNRSSQFHASVRKQSKDVNDIQSSVDKDSKHLLPLPIVVWFVFLAVALLAGFIALIAAFVLMNSLRSSVVVMERLQSSSQQNVSCTEPTLANFQNQLESLQTKIHKISNIDTSLDNISRERNESLNIQSLLVASLITLRRSVDVSLQQTNSSVIRVLEVSDILSQNISDLGETFRSETNRLSTQVVNDIRALYVFDSCASIRSFSLPFPSSIYRVRSRDGFFVPVFCSMELSCNAITGGWRRLAYFDASNVSAECYNGFKPFLSIPRSCIRSDTVAGCTSVIFNNTGAAPYNQICGRVTVSPTGSPNGLLFANPNAIDNTYVDGVSLTYGTRSRRKHIWTHAVLGFSNFDCSDCSRNGKDFIGSNYTCVGRYCSGSGCNEDRCGGNPTFYRQLPSPITDNIEMRICRNQRQANEDILLEKVEIYVQ